MKNIFVVLTALIASQFIGCTSPSQRRSEAEQAKKLELETFITSVTNNYEKNWVSGTVYFEWHDKTDLIISEAPVGQDVSCLVLTVSARLELEWISELEKFDPNLDVMKVDTYSTILLPTVTKKLWTYRDISDLIKWIGESTSCRVDDVKLL